MHLYRRARDQARKALAAARTQGYQSVVISGDGDIADVCRLTCLESGFSIGAVGAEDGSPVLHIEGSEITLRMPAQEVPIP